MNETTKGGLNLAKQPPVYDGTTNQAEEFINALLKSIRLNGTAGPDDGNKAVEVRLNSVRSGKRFVPMVAILPMSAREGYDDSYDENDFDLATALNNEDDDGYVRLRPYVYEVLSQFAFSKEEMDNIMSPKFRNANNMRLDAAKNLKSIRRPCIVNYGGKKKIALAINPIPLFHLMANDDDNSDYRINLKPVKRIKDMNWLYQITKKRNKNKYDGDFLKKMNIGH